MKPCIKIGQSYELILFMFIQHQWNARIDLSAFNSLNNKHFNEQSESG